jgi:hypothetical protein
MHYYLLVLIDGDMTRSDDCFESALERDEAAKSLWQSMKPDNGDNIFKADVSASGNLHVEPYLIGELDQ